MSEEAAALRACSLILRHTRDVLVVTDARGRIEWVNPSSRLFAGLDPGQFRGKDFAAVFSGPDTPVSEVINFNTAIETAKTARLEFKNGSRGKDNRWIEIDLTPVLGDNGIASNFIAAGRDITDRKLKEHQLQAALIESGRHSALLNAQNKDLFDAKAKIELIAHHDVLTGLANRFYFQDRLNDVLSYLRGDRLIAIHLIDLDSFKTVNDTLGHPAGDRLLNWVAGRLRQQVRDSDFIARIGGDEFAIIQVDLKSNAEAISLAERIVQIGSEYLDASGTRMEVGLSAGIAIAPTDGLTPDELLKHADLALYQSKAAGRGVFHFFDNRMKEFTEARRLLESDIRRAIINEEFTLFFQPLLNVKRNEICGFEALIRWQHPKKGLLAPSDFLFVAERMGLMGVIDEWLILTACSAASAWPDNIRLSVNLSPVHLNKGSLAAYVAKVLKVAGLAAHRLEFEITEATVLESSETTLGILRDLRAQGIGVAMDDFGTGYSSLASLQRHPFTRIKIDGSFVQRFLTDSQSAIIVRSVIGLASALGMATTAEGIERLELFEALRLEGCIELQGFFVGRPVPAGEVSALLSSKSRRSRTTPNSPRIRRLPDVPSAFPCSAAAAYES